MAEIADMGKWVFSDEIYHGLVYEGRARSILEFTPKNALSSTAFPSCSP